MGIHIHPLLLLLLLHPQRLKTWRLQIQLLGGIHLLCPRWWPLVSCKMSCQAQCVWPHLLRRVGWPGTWQR